MNLLDKVLYMVSANRLAQNLLLKNILISQNMMGIGTGARASISGEQAIFDILEERNEPPLCIFDVGANKGQFLQLALDCIATDDFSVHCFEPAHATFNQLTENAVASDRIRLINNGLGKEKGSLDLYYTHPGSVLASLTKRRLAHYNMDFNRSETVEIDTVDNYCGAHFIEKIDLLKLDVEGHELDVLTGASGMLEKEAIDMISFEFGGCNIDTRTFFQDFWYFFLDLNMTLNRITPTGYLSPLTSYSEVNEQFRTTNYLALKITEI